MSSTLFKNLIKTEDRLSKLFMDFPRNSLGRYNNESRLKSAAYVVLLHAAIEQYVEDTCLKILHCGKQNFINKSKINRIVAFVMNHVNESYPDSKPTTDKLSSRVYRAIKIHENVISNNHGIKEINLFRLFFPIGFDFILVDSLFLPEANSFGSLRGDFAHRSIKNYNFDPYQNLAAAKQFLTMINDFDTNIIEYLKSNR